MRIDPTTQPGAAWEHTAVIAGVECKLLPPCRVDGDPGQQRPRGLIGLPVLLWRGLRVLLLGRDARRLTVARVRALIEPGMRPLVERERTGVLQEIIVHYRGLERGYQAALVEHAQRTAMRDGVGGSIVERARAVSSEPSAPERATSPTPPPPPPVRAGGVPIRPGEPLPHVLSAFNGDHGPVRFGAGANHNEGGATG